MNLSQRIELWLSQHPDATPREAIWAGARIEIELWCSGNTHTSTLNITFTHDSNHRSHLLHHRSSRGVYHRKRFRQQF